MKILTSICIVVAVLACVVFIAPTIDGDPAVNTGGTTTNLAPGMTTNLAPGMTTNLAPGMTTNAPTR
jgi:hypothetical protein